jgi:hypothetical protein
MKWGVQSEWKGRKRRVEAIGRKVLLNLLLTPQEILSFFVTNVMKNMEKF